MEWKDACAALVFACLTATLHAQDKPGPAAAQPEASVQRFSCHPRATPVTDAEAALSREDYVTALDLFRKTEDQNTSRAGVIRTLLEEDKVADAQQLASDWTAKEAGNAVALETLAEVLFRAGKLPAAYKMTQQAAALDHCLARTFLMDSAFENVTANYALSRKHIETAHKLDAADPEIRRAWISTLPNKQRLEQLTALADDARLLNEKDRTRLRDSVAHAADTSNSDCSVAAAGNTAQPSGETIPIELTMASHSYDLALDVRFNGKRRRLVIDTGASGLVLSRSAASGLGLVRERQVHAEGVGDNGEVATSIAHVASVTIGNLEFRNCAVEILEKRSALDVDGLIGSDVFSKFLVTLDFPNRQLRLNTIPPRPDEKTQQAGLVTNDAKPAGDAVKSGDSGETAWHDRYIAPSMTDWTPIYRRGHDLLIPVHVGEAQERLFLVDTGAASMLITPEAAREVTKVKRNSDVGIRGISGEVEKVYETGKFTFYFAHLKQTVDAMTSIDTTKISHDAGIEISGFLGAPVLQMLAVHIDYRDNLMKFDYVTKH